MGKGEEVYVKRVRTSCRLIGFAKLDRKLRFSLNLLFVVVLVEVLKFVAIEYFATRDRRTWNSNPGDSSTRRLTLSCLLLLRPLDRSQEASDCFFYQLPLLSLLLLFSYVTCRSRASKIVYSTPIAFNGYGGGGGDARSCLCR